MEGSENTLFSRGESPDQKPVQLGSYRAVEQPQVFASKFHQMAARANGTLNPVWVVANAQGQTAIVMAGGELHVVRGEASGPPLPSYLFASRQIAQDAAQLLGGLPDGEAADRLAERLIRSAVECRRLLTRVDRRNR